MRKIAAAVTLGLLISTPVLAQAIRTTPSMHPHGSAYAATIGGPLGTPDEESGARLRKRKPGYWWAGLAVLATAGVIVAASSGGSPKSP